jgi:hypothetical protein
VPLDAKTLIYVDGKESSGETVFAFGGGGGCPCTVPACMPYCRPIGSVLTENPTPAPTPPQ